MNAYRPPLAGVSDSGHAPLPDPAGHPAKMSTPLKIFLIEDSTAIRETLIQSMESADSLKVVGYADNAKDAVRQLRETAADVVIVDLQLKQGSGFEALTALQSMRGMDGLVRIVLTNYVAPVYRQRCAALGAQHFFDKSLEFDRVIGMLHDLAHPQSPQSSPAAH